MNSMEIMGMIKSDFEKLKEFYGINELEMPEINFVAASNQEANCKMGACKFTMFPVSMKEMKVKTMNIINIFIENAKSIVDNYIKESNTYKATKLFVYYIRYIAIHEMVHHIQMHLGLTVKVVSAMEEAAFSKVLEEVESKCTNDTAEFIKKTFRGDKLFEQLSKLDMTSFAEQFGKLEKEEIEKLKSEIKDSINNSLDDECVALG